MAVGTAEWLAKTFEDPLEPELEIVDPHHHLWDHPGSRYMQEELRADTGAGHRVLRTVFVECGSGYRTDGPPALRPVGETDFVEAVSTATPVPGTNEGIVGHADLLLGENVADALDAHLAASSRFRGIRHSAAWDASDAIRRSHSSPPPHMLLDETFRRGFACLAPRGLSFDAWLYHPQIPELTDLARAFPDTTIVCDHVGGPLGIGPYADRREQVFEIWRENVTALSGCPNTVVKLGGLAMPINGWGFHRREKPPGSGELADALAPYLEHCIETFGPERCMFESNFPVDKASCSYTVLWNAFKRVASGRSAADKASLFRRTAERVYRLD